MLNKTEKYLRNARAYYKRTGNGVGAFLPTVSEYRAMSKAEKRFYQTSVVQLKRKSPFQKGRDIKRGSVIKKIVNKAPLIKTTARRSSELSRNVETVNQAVFAVDAKENKIFEKNKVQTNEKINRMHNKGTLWNVKSEKDYSNVMFDKVLNTKVLGDSRINFNLLTSTKIKDKYMRYEAYESENGDGFVIIDTSKPGKTPGKSKFEGWRPSYEEAKQAIADLEEQEKGEESIEGDN